MTYKETASVYKDAFHRYEAVLTQILEELVRMHNDRIDGKESTRYDVVMMAAKGKNPEIELLEQILEFVNHTMEEQDIGHIEWRKERADDE